MQARKWAREIKSQINFKNGFLMKFFLEIDPRKHRLLSNKQVIKKQSALKLPALKTEIDFESAQKKKGVSLENALYGFQN